MGLSLWAILNAMTGIAACAGAAGVGVRAASSICLIPGRAVAGGSAPGLSVSDAGKASSSAVSSRRSQRRTEGPSPEGGVGGEAVSTAGPPGAGTGADPVLSTLSGDGEAGVSPSSR